MRFASLILIIPLGACGGHYRTEMVGHGSLGTPVQLADAAYDLALDLQTPRAQVVTWQLSCGGAEVANGTVGEPFAQYRTRRLAQLKEDVANQKAVASGVTSLLVGAVAPRAKAGPVTARVDPDAAGAAAAATIDDRVELPPGDVGAGVLTVRTHVSAAGACTVSATADDPAVAGTYRITRVHDLDAEAHDRVVVANAGAVDVRARVATQLVAVGADAGARERRRLAFEADAERRELAVRADAERQRVAAERLVAIRLAGEAQQRHELEVAIAAQRRIAIDVRMRIYGELVLWGADEGLRARREAEVELRTRAERARVDAAAEAYAERVRLADEARGRQDELRITLALNARTQLRGYLVGLGAVERPPMPELIAEAHGAVPFEGAVWLAGRWRWNSRQWVWLHGGWSDPSTFGEAGGDPAPSVAPVAPVVETPAVVVTAPPPVVETPSVVVTAPPPVVVETPSAPTITIHVGHAAHPVHRAPPAKKQAAVKHDRRR